jgi:hypothetical protein
VVVSVVISSSSSSSSSPFLFSKFILERDGFLYRLPLTQALSDTLNSYQVKKTTERMVVVRSGVGWQ